MTDFLSELIMPHEWVAEDGFEVEQVHISETCRGEIAIRYDKVNIVALNDTKLYITMTDCSRCQEDGHAKCQEYDAYAESVRSAMNEAVAMNQIYGG